MNVRGLLRCGLAMLLGGSLSAAEPSSPGKIHIPIGIPDSLDTLKTFVEPDGSFSPGFGSFGVSFRLNGAPETAGESSPRAHGLLGGGLLMPWCELPAPAGLSARVELCQVERESPVDHVQFVAARVKLSNVSDRPITTTLSVVITPEGPAGGALPVLTFSQHAFSTGGHPVLIAEEPSNGAVLASGPFAPRPLGPQQEAQIESAEGDCRGEMLFDVALAPFQTRTIGFFCPVLPGRRAVGHRWDVKSKWAQLDLSDPVSGDGGNLQGDAGLDFYRGLKIEDVFTAAEQEWWQRVGQVRIELPDPRWEECFTATTGHVALAMNEGAPDVAVINYNVFNRDGVYVANMLQKAGATALAERVIDYFLAHPFNGRVEPEADNPGQILWIMGEHWKFTKDRKWLDRVYPAARLLASMIQYYRTSPEPHFVNPTRMDFGNDLPPSERFLLLPGACDGHHPEYTEAFDLAGLRAFAVLREASKGLRAGMKGEGLIEQLAKDYDQHYGADLRKGEYGNYSVLWPCRLYPLDSPQAREQFGKIGGQKPTRWRYFPLARAHQGLLAGNRAAAAETLQTHLDHEQMQGWYAFDEGGPSGPGNWSKIRSNWPVVMNPDGTPKSAMAMPHGWAIAEMQLLLRDALAFEDGQRLVLFAGVPPEWFAQPMSIENLPTYFGKVSVWWTPEAGGGTLQVFGADPGCQIVLRGPQGDVNYSGKTMFVPVPNLEVVK